MVEMTSTIRTQRFADEIFRKFRGTSEGHCARVDFLSRDEAFTLCRFMRQQPKVTTQVSFYVLKAKDAPQSTDDLFITTDEAIEIRNRKQGRLCLFVPSDLVDAAYSSLSNSFAPIDGRTLQADVLRHLRHSLPDSAQQVLSFVGSRSAVQASLEQRLDFAIAALNCQANNTLESLGLELWRVGLIADARPDFVEHLTSNKNSTIALSRPPRLDATTRERIQSLRVDKETAINLERFFRGRSVNDVPTWSRELTKVGLTLDRWVFLQNEKSDIRAITIRPFINKHGDVERYCLLSQPDQTNGSLRASCGPKSKMVVQWSCEPEQPRNVSSWSIRILPAELEIDEEPNEESDFIEPKIPRVPGPRRKVTIKLDIEEEELPSGPVCVRVTALDAAGNEIISEETGRPVADKSTEFFLVKDPKGPVTQQQRESRSTVPTIAYGRLETALEISEHTIEETQVQWSEKEMAYLSLPLSVGHKTLNIGLSKMLIELERRILSEPRRGGCFILQIDEIYPATADQCDACELLAGQDGAWIPFWKAREAFFVRLKKATPRDVIAAADWTPELTRLALNYAQSYHTLLKTLLESHCEQAELRDALSIDSLLISVAGKDDEKEEAIIILPTHPLRVAWYAGYTQLFRYWGSRLLEMTKNERKRSIDLHLLRLLTPQNTPAFAHHNMSSETFLFFQNLRFFYGIALPASVADPHRRYTDLASIVGIETDETEIGSIQPIHLKEHLTHFHELHQYTQTLVTMLINPGRGKFFAEAIDHFLNGQNTAVEADEVTHIPGLQITAYMHDGHVSPLRAIEQVRQKIDQQYQQAKDYFLPTLSTSVRPLSRLEHHKSLPEAHIAIITDFTRPTLTSLPQAEIASDESSFSLYGLMTRFLPQFSFNGNDFLWRYTISTDSLKKPDAHPAGTRYSDTLLDLHQSMLNAGGYLTTLQSDKQPVLEVRLQEQQRILLDRLHSSTNWVITLDRFFTLDYYDSPHEPHLKEMAQKYVLDYSPEAIEGLGHRMMVTTSWHEEIESLLAQAMEELGFQSIDKSVGHLLHHLKTVSGRLALQALESPTSAAAAVGLGVVTAYLKQTGRLSNAILIPADAYPRIFSSPGENNSQHGERRCDLVLIALRRNIVEATFIEVKWRRGQTPLRDLAEDMALQMAGSAQAMRHRFFNEQRIDGTLQRAYLANILKFYFERARRYQLFKPEAEKTFLEQLVRLEKASMPDFRVSYEGYIVSLDGTPRRPLSVNVAAHNGLPDEARIVVLTAQSLNEASTPTFDYQGPSVSSRQPEADTFSNSEVKPVHNDIDDDEERENHPPVAMHTYRAENLSDETAKPANEEITVPLGTNISTNEPVIWQPGTKGSPHLFIMGIPGQGKSWTITRILCELGKQQVPTLVLDFHGQFVGANSPFARLVQPTVVDAADGLPFSPFECTTNNDNSGWRANSLALAEIFASIVNLGDMQQDVIYTALQDAYKTHGFDDKEMDSSGIEYPTPEEVLRRIEQKEQARHIHNVAARCRPLLEMNLFRPIKDSPDLLFAIRQGLIIDLHNLYSEMLQVATGAFVLRKLYKDMFHWGSADRLRLAIVLDEAHRLARDVTLPKIMKEGRKFGIAVIVASQGIGDFHQDILGNAGTKVIFRINHPDSKKVAGFIRARSGQDVAARIEQLSVGSAYVQTPDMPFGSIVKMYPLE
jgi:DNA phosphorothioation-dependent restriction protein DptH